MTKQDELWFDVRRFDNGNKVNITGYVGFNTAKCERVRGQLTRLPGSPTIWVSHGLFIAEEHRRKGYSQAYNAFMLGYAWSTLNASAVMASVKHDNTTQQERLYQLGWRQMSNSMYIVTPNPSDGDDDSYSTLFDFYPRLNENIAEEASLRGHIYDV